MSSPQIQRLPIPWYRAVVIFRSLGVILLISLFDALQPLGTSPLLTSLAGIAAVIGASRLAQTRLTNFGFIAGFAGLSTILAVLFWALNLTLSGFTPSYFLISRLHLHVQLCLIVAFISGLLTWIFWRVRAAITFEAIVMAAIAILIFSGHREYHLDRPKLINVLAWRLGVTHLSMLIVIGSSLLALSLCYLYLASQAVRPRVENISLKTIPARRSWISSTLAAISLGLIVFGVQYALYAHYNAAMLARVSNGVGMGESLGISPLTFQSALGSTNQPAGLIRLEGDYADNPFTPMLYLRESALSQFNGREMVFAGRAFDTDLPVVSPQSTFTGKEDPDLAPRTPLIQSIYPLADHDSAFAVDYPLSIVQLKNPNPSRFKSAYRAYSIAPAFPLSSITKLAVGDSRWPAEVQEHYLKQHSDLRYRDLAVEITKGLTNPVEKINAITNYISRTAIYTLTPNHTVEPTQDPVAPFLFGDHRGYCVHFAHAIVFMLRALQIPARIGTGYLTDLSQAKDGHILLRMSDRHAWAEAYVAKTGWVPFDVQPDQVESHADTQVDTKLLEELMGSLEPGEEILPSDTTKDEAGMVDSDQSTLPSATTLLWGLAIVISVMTATKLALRHAWRLSRTARGRARWGYISVASALYDQGYMRAFGETRLEFAARTPDSILLPLSSALNQETYALAPKIKLEQLDTAIKEAHRRLHMAPWWRRLLTALNPGSITHALGGGSW